MLKANWLIASMWAMVEHLVPAKARGLVVRVSLSGGLVGALIAALIVVVIFVALAPVVADQVSGVNLANFTNGSGALFGLTTLFFVILGIVGIVKMIR